MKKPDRHFLLAARSRRKYAFVCASILVVSALMMGLFTSVSLFSSGGRSVMIKHIHIQGDLFSRVQAIETKDIKIAHKSNTSSSMHEEDNQSKLSSTYDIVHFGKRNVLHNGLPHDNVDGEVISSIKHDDYKGSFSKRNVQEMKPGGCTKSKALLKVFMYDLPQEFHFGMIEPRNGSTWSTNFTNIVSYPRGLYQQHSPEYWLTLDLLYNMEEEEGEGEQEEGRHNSLYPGRRRPCTAIRVKEARDADVCFVPFFASLSYNKYTRLGMGEKDIELQHKVVEFVVKQETWKRSKGRDHVIVMHHPNSLHIARTFLQGATFVVADFGRFSSKVAHFGKDVVAPYKHIIPSFHGDHSSFHSRPTLLFFQGALSRKEGGMIRKKLYRLIKNEKGVVFKNGISGGEGIKSATRGMRCSKFCLHLAGDTPSSNRLFDAIASQCVPVIISEDLELPYENVLDYTRFCLFVNYSQALKKGFLINLLRGIGRDEWTRMWKRLSEVRVHFEYQFPSQEDDAVQMVWKSIAHKVPSIKQGLHKSTRYSRSDIFKQKLSL